MLTVRAPSHYAELVAPLPRGARLTTRASRHPGFVHVFATSRTELRTQLARLRRMIAPNGIVWVSWPKRSADTDTDVTEDVIRDEALPLGFVDVKVCAVDETWSGLKLVIRRTLRPSVTGRRRHG